MSGLVEVTVIYVGHPDTRSPIRRWIYMILEKNAIPTDIGWIVEDEDTLRKIMHLAERARKVEGVEDAVKVYKVYIPVSTYEQLITSRRKKKKRGAGVAESG